MVREFKKAPKGFDHLLVTIDKFTKWIEYKPLVQATAKKVAEY